jgi:hypothetical protein
MAIGSHATNGDQLEATSLDFALSMMPTNFAGMP